MKSCPYCRKPVEEGDTVCTNCWKQLPKPGERIPGKAWYGTIGPLGWVAIFFFVLLAIFGSMLINQNIENARRRASAPPTITPSPRPDVGTDIGAFVICKQFVTETLTSPSSAEFQSMVDAQVIKYKPNRWEVTAWVEADNSFGASIRDLFTCRVEYQGAGNWTLIDLQKTNN
jgi:hypothetical protein